MNDMLVITGATGPKSGGAFAGKLAENFETVRRIFPGGIRALVRPSSDVAALKAKLPDVETAICDLEDADALVENFRNADTVVHIAGIHWSRQVVDAAAVAGVRRLVMVHTTGIYSKYKAAGEEYRQIDAHVYAVAKEKGIALTILRPTMIYGNLSDQNVATFIKMVDRLPVMPVVNGARYALQPVHYADLADAYYRVLVDEEKTAGKDFDLSGGKPIELREMLVEIGRQLGKKVRFVSCPFPVAYLGAWGVFCLSLGQKDFREKVQRLCEPRAYQHDAAAETFGYSPVEFAKGVEGEIQEYLALKTAPKS